MDGFESCFALQMITLNGFLPKRFAIKAKIDLMEPNNSLVVREERGKDNLRNRIKKTTSAND